MKNIPTPHIEAKEGEVAKTVLMPGDPLRAKYIAENYLTNVKQFNAVRGMLGFTGEYKGKRISVMGSGMGMPSIGIYSYELFNFYDVDNIIRVGSCGSYLNDYKLKDVVYPTYVKTESTYGIGANYLSKGLNPSQTLNHKLVESARELNIILKGTSVHSADVFYAKEIDTLGCCVVEMELYALIVNAQKANKQATGILTVSDMVFDLTQTTTSEERERSFDDMIKIALEATLKI